MIINWQTKKLGEVCYFYNGLWKGKKPPYVNVGVIRNTNFTKDGYLDDAEIVFLDVEEKQFQKRELKYGDIILEKSGGGPKQPVGRVIVFDKKEGSYSFSNFTSAIRVKNVEELDFNFLHKFLHFAYILGITEKMQSHSTGIRNLDLGAYKNIGIPLPPLVEQRRIVKILDEVFEGIGKAKENVGRNLKNSKELFESYLNDVFAHPGEGWEKKKLGEVLNIQNGYAFDSKNFSALQGMPLIRIRDLKNSITTDTRYMGDYDGRYIVHKGDFLIGMDGEFRCYEWKGEDALLNQRVCRLQDFKNIDPRFLFYGVNKHLKAIEDVTTYTTVKHLASRQIENIEFLLPPREDQEFIVKNLDKLLEQAKKLEEIYRGKLTDLEELKKSVLQKAFRGEL